MIFCDTSAVAKLYVVEIGSPAMRALLEAEDQVFASELARPELMSVFHRQLREKKWTRDKFLTAVRQFSNDDIGGFWTWLPLDTTIIEAAAKTYATLPATVFLRSADCLHLVTAMHHGFAEIYTYDTHQNAAATALGIRPVTV
ncbi:MAG: type II toxin-antitoxin system VapC family toxin [Opitutaceae bacterium]|nr:type II toxin-antitoxin system VapC family toxin [Opitutaceae bacterium]